jgi:uncharacterized repeat protein (TIGR01451 family)
MFEFDQMTRPTSAESGRYRGRIALVGVLALLTLTLALVQALPAGAEGLSPQWTVTAISRPTNLAPGETGEYVVEVKNTGGAASDGSELTVTDILPAGLTLAGLITGREVLAGNPVVCVAAACAYSGVIVPDDSLVLAVPVKVEAGPFVDSCEVPTGAVGCLTSLVSVSGGGAVEAVRETPTVISTKPAEFGIAPGSLATVLSSTQAGAHADLTTSLAFNTVDTKGKLPASPRSTTADLPPGFVGDLADSPTCPIATFDEQVAEFVTPQVCGLTTQVGTTRVLLGTSSGAEEITVPVYNLTPNPGEVAKLGFVAKQFGVQGTLSLRPSNYGVRTSFQNISGVFYLDAVSLTIWGVPAAESHNQMRGLICNGSRCDYFSSTRESGPFGGHSVAELPGGESSSSPEIPFLTSPTQCTSVPLEASFAASAWEPGVAPVSAKSPIGPLTGCNFLEFTPWIVASPDTSRADTPAGLTADVKVHQEGLVTPKGFSTADLQNTTVKLPAGVAVNPGQAAGLQACQEGPTEPQSPNGELRHPGRDNLPLAGENGEEGKFDGPADCPIASKVGEVKIETPVLKHDLEGDVYLLQSNPPNLKLLVAASAPVYGIYVKLVGDVHLDPVTGQLTTTFTGTPELPFSDFKLSFSGGAQAALSTPTACGTYTSNADFTPWTTPVGADVFSSSPFAITSGTAGAPCPPSPLPFTPSLIAGATTDQAGGFTHFSMLLQSADDQQRISRLQFKAPPGLSGMLSSVPLCGEPQAAQGTCSAASQIGHTVVASGPGPYPLVVPQPGQPPAAIYLTGSYAGAPFGLSIVVPIVVGPFVLETQVVRAKIEVDPITAQIIVTTNPLPQIIDGVPTDLRTVNAVIDRSGFMFNPTNCSPQAFSGTATSAEGTNAPISSRFQVGSCQSLKFNPKFTMATTGHSSRTAGASLTTKLTEPAGALGTQANIRSVKVDLPRALPSRLSTLQKACLAAVFNANPASCPVGSIVGHARAVTPILPVALTGPAYFVSNGGAKFPELVIVLQGDGVTIDLHGETDIKSGVTSSTFHTVPDQPVTSFELTLPQGKGSALASNLPAKDRGNFCGQRLTSPTALVGQNGLEIHQNTPVTVTGCSPSRAQKLAAALKACTKKTKGKRASCATAARRRYVVNTNAKGKKKQG